MEFLKTKSRSFRSLESIWLNIYSFIFYLLSSTNVKFFKSNFDNSFLLANSELIKALKRFELIRYILKLAIDLDFEQSILQYTLYSH